MANASMEGLADDQISRARKRTRTAWTAAGILLLVAAAAGVYAANLRIQLQDVELRLVDAVTKLQDSQERLVGAANEIDAFRSNLGLMSAADAIDLKLAGRGSAEKAVGRAFVSSKGLLVSASGLPPLSDERTYQVWLLGKGAPVNAGALHPDQQGNATAAFDMPPDAPQPVSGLQVSAELEGASTPIGAVVLASK